MTVMPKSVVDVERVLEDNGLPPVIGEVIADISDPYAISIAWFGSDYFFSALYQAFQGFNGSDKEACELAEKVVARPQDFQEPQALVFR